MTYSETDLTRTIERLLEEAGWTSPLTPEHLDRVDQFHAGGIDAVDALVPAMGAGPGDQILDVGSGLGGPARRIAQQTGAAVHGIDLTQSYVDAATALTARCALDQLVSFEQGDIAGWVPSRRFDAAVTMHVQMNAPDKAAFFAAIHGALRPGGRLALWEICATGADTPPWPMPWSIDGSDSYLATSDELRGAAVDSGFDVLEWTDQTQWVMEWFAASFNGGPPPGPSLPLLLTDGFTRVLNLAQSLSDGTLSVVRGVLAAKAS